jgi:hypothetical protein
MTRGNRWSRNARIATWTGAAVLVVVVGCAVWVVTRGVLAKDQLTEAEPLVSQIESNIAGGHQAQAVVESKEFSAHAAKAVSLTSDPIWRVLQYVPLVGPNLRAVRVAAETTDTVAVGVVEPLTETATQLNVESFKPVNGVVDVAQLKRVHPALRSAADAMDRAAAQLHGAPSGGTIPVVTRALTKLRSTVEHGKTVVGSVDRAAALLPAMLGASGPRNYLLLFLNPAELRSTGGIAGSLALVHSDDGHVSLVAQDSADTGGFVQPVAPLPDAVRSLFGTRPARYFQDVNLTPDFPLSASLAASMWTSRYGTKVDGVIALDPVVLGYILRATGPIHVTGDLTLTSSNAAPLLLSQVYQIFPDNTEQNAFFAAAAAAVFQHVTAGDVDPYALITAVVKGAMQQRIHVWSAHPEEEKTLSPTTLAGELPVSDPGRAAIGVYLNDATGAKLDYYLDATATTSSRVCPTSGAPESIVTIRLTNGVPPNAVGGLPTYVTNVTNSGVPAGTVVTQVAAYGPSGSLLAATTRNGSAVAAQTEIYHGRPVSQFELTLSPGASETVSVRFVDEHQRWSASTSLVMTPGLHSRVVSDDANLCDQVQIAPIK